MAVFPPENLPEHDEEEPVNELQLDDVGVTIPDTGIALSVPDSQECPRKPELIVNRKCYKKCSTNAECRGRNKQCLCDDVCGKSCVNPSECQHMWLLSCSDGNQTRAVLNDVRD